MTSNRPAELSWARIVQGEICSLVIAQSSRSGYGGASREERVLKKIQKLVLWTPRVEDIAGPNEVKLSRGWLYSDSSHYRIYGLETLARSRLRLVKYTDMHEELSYETDIR